MSEMKNTRQKISTMPSGNKFVFEINLYTLDMRSNGIGYFTNIEAKAYDCIELNVTYIYPFFNEKIKIDPSATNVDDIIGNMEVAAKEAFWRLIEGPMIDFVNQMNPHTPVTTKDAPKSRLQRFLNRIFG